jgi:hypothetical protein
MATEKFSRERTIYVSVPQKMTLEQTNELTKKLLGVVGHPGCYSGFHFNFIEEVEVIRTSINARGEIAIGV